MCQFCRTSDITIACLPTAQFGRKFALNKLHATELRHASYDDHHDFVLLAIELDLQKCSTWCAAGR